MKTILPALILIASGLCAQAQYQPLTTTDGATYNGITSQRIDADGVYIEYTLPGGGFGVSKVKFARLSRAQRKQFGFNASKARDYEAEVAQANEDCSQELKRRYQIERDARLQRDRENESAYAGRMAAILRMNEAQAALELGSGSSPIGRSSGSGPGFSAEFTSGHVSTETSYSPVFTPDIFPNRGVVVRSH